MTTIINNQGLYTLKKSIQDRAGSLRHRTVLAIIHFIHLLQFA